MGKRCWLDRLANIPVSKLPVVGTGINGVRPYNLRNTINVDLPYFTQTKNKIHMKRVFTYTFMILSLAIGLTACSDDGDDSPKSTEKYFAISNGSYVNESFPTATSADSSLNLSINSQLNSGETANLFISADNEVSKVFIGVKGTNGYWAYDPTSNLQTRASNTAFPSANYKTYLIPITISQSYNGNLSLIVSVQYADGGISYPIIQNVQVAKNSSSDSKDSTINVPEYLKPFVGLWDINSHYSDPNYYNLFLFQDGVAINRSKDRDDNQPIITTWNYNPVTQYLALAGYDKAQWQITAISDNAWSGLELWSGRKLGYKAEKNNNYMYQFYDIQMNYHELWKCDTIKAGIMFCEHRRRDGWYYSSNTFVVYKGNPTIEYENYYYTFYGKSSVSNLYQFAWYSATENINTNHDSEYNKDKDCYVCKSENWENPNTTGHYIEMVHPYSYKDVYLNITFRYRNNQNKIETWSGKFLPSK